MISNLIIITILGIYRYIGENKWTLKISELKFSTNVNFTFPETVYEDMGFKLKDYLLDNCRVYKWS